MAGDDLDARIDLLLSRLGLEDKPEARPGELSRGMRQKVQLACALVRPHRLLVLDEPVVGLDPSSQLTLRELLLEAKSAVAAIVITATAATTLARRRTGTASAEVFLARAQTRSGRTASAFTLDYRTAALTYRSALPARAIRLGRFRRPQQARRVILWRDSLAIVRAGTARLGDAVRVAAVVEALTHPGRWR